MNLRLRLIVAFFLLSVVPLGAVTLYTYTSNAKALRLAAGHEAELLAGELTQRMELVTAQLSERVEHLMDISTSATQTAAATPPKSAGKAPAAGKAPTAASVAASSSTDRVADALGDVAMLLNNIEVRGARGFGGGGGRGRGGPGGPGGVNGGAGAGGAAPVGSGAPPGRDTSSARATPSFGPPPPRPDGTSGPSGPSDCSRGFPPPGRGDGPPPGLDPTGATAGASGAATGSPANPGGPNDRGRGGPGGPGGGGGFRGAPPDATAADDPTRIRIDLMPIRREIMQQFATEEQWPKLTDDERQRIIAEVNQRMLGIEQGIHMGAAESGKRVAEAQRAAQSKAHEAAQGVKAQQAAANRQTANTPGRTTPAAANAGPVAPTAPAAPPAPAAPVTPRERRTALSGSHLDVTVERNGEVVRQVGAEVNLPNLLATVFTATRRDRGEVPFAVAKDGKLYTQTDEDRKQIERFGSAATLGEAAPGTKMVGDWIVVTTADPTGSGLKFGIARPVGDSLSDLRRTTARNAGFGLAFIGFALIGIVPLSSGLTRNLSRLSDGVRRLASGDYRARVEVRSQDEVGRLAFAFNQMAADVERHQQSAVDQERIRRELELGRQIQHDMLPQAPFKLGLTEIKGVSVPAREVGGDFFNYFQLPTGQIALLVGDVSGKGVGAALLMANIQASLRTRLALGQDLAALARELDVDVEGNTPGPVYATLFVGMLDPITRELRYVNAGHNPQDILRVDHSLERMTSSGLPVGLLSGRGYAEDRVQLAPGDVLFFYTDGCIEAENERGEMFSADRLETLLTSVSSGDDVLARVEQEVSRFRGTREPFDDATMMAVKVG